MNDRPSALRIWVLAARPKTLPAALVPVLVGSAFAARAGAFRWEAAALCLLFSLLVQIGTNFANDYFDHVQGADTEKRVGPARAVASGWVTPATMHAAMWATFGVALLVGLGLIPFGGWGLLPLGVLSILCGIAYTGGPYPLGYHGLGDVFVFLFFGLVAVGATFWVQTRALSPDVLLAAAAIGGLAANILVANNYRDRETDVVAGKRTLVVRLGERAGRVQYGAAVVLSGLVPVALWWRGFGAGPLLALGALPLGVACWRKLQPTTPAPELIRLLARTAAHLALFGVLLSLGLLVAR
ncbi:MAG TPA: 1,4-dihydroxy-2-naphthoate polyprenyltransferase [Opitutaceae bacterium]|nr:1,4-dihydroxy-2-naphthoate polyprenyltransferase [Opitutaceae bacterium]